MKKRLIAVGAIGLLIVGAWFGNLFRGFGLGGSGSGEGDNDRATGDVQVSLDTGEPSLTAGLTSATATSSTAEGAPVADEVVTVVITTDRYELQSGDDATARFEPATKEAIVELAKSRKGDAHGVRVRLRFKPDAHSGATSDLYSALQEADISREQVIEAKGYVE